MGFLKVVLFIIKKLKMSILWILIEYLKTIIDTRAIEYNFLIWMFVTKLSQLFKRVLDYLFIVAM
jgi:hypothetical protein